MSFDQFSLPVSVPLDDDGFFARRCPSIECSQPFKVSFEDWRDKVSDEIAYCPFCRHQATAQEYNTEDQNQYFRDVAMAEVQRQVGQMLSGMARTFNRRQPRQSLLSVRMDVTTAPLPMPHLPAVEEPLTLRISCEVCGCRTAVIGAGFLCTACGHNSADNMFDQALVKCRAAIAALPSIRQALTDRDQRAQVVQALIENQIANLVTAFSRFAEASYAKLPHPSEMPRRNAFQNLTKGNDLWIKAGGTPFTDILSDHEFRDVRLNFQKRHLLEHQQRIGDQDYLDKSGESTYSLGQRIVVREASVTGFTDLLEKLVRELRNDLFTGTNRSE